MRAGRQIVRHDASHDSNESLMVKRHLVNPASAESGVWEVEGRVVVERGQVLLSALAVHSHEIELEIGWRFVGIDRLSGDDGNVGWRGEGHVVDGVVDFLR